jgi:hypothetical protein
LQLRVPDLGVSSPKTYYLGHIPQWAAGKTPTPRAPIDLMPLPSSEKLNFDAKQLAELMLKLHETTKENIECMKSKYKLAGDKGRKQLIFEPGELVWLHLRKDRFLALRKSKLMPQADVWQNRLNYSSSSALVIAIQPILTQCTSNGTTHWSVGSPPDATTVQQDQSRFTSHEGKFTVAQQLINF